MVACGVERNGLGNLRYQHHGKRLVIVVALPRVQKFAAAKGITMMEKESVADFWQRVLEALKPEDVTEEDQKMESSQIWKHTMEPNEVMAIPAGCFTMEQTVALSAENRIIQATDCRFICHWFADTLFGRQRFRFGIMVASNERRP